jgi:hypothetical protein
MTNLELEIAKLTQRVATLEAREQARRISEGLDEPHHIGPKTREVLIQEIYSLFNTKEAFRKPDFDEQILARWDELAKLVGDVEADSAVQKLYQFIAHKRQEIAEKIRSARS